MGVREVFEVLYSPVKAFKKIIEKPDFKGVLLIFVLFLSFTAVEQYAIASKLLLQRVTPDKDAWTESITLWTSNGVRSNNTNRIVGNYSVKSFVSNDTNIWMKITDIGPIDSSEETGYKELFFRINWTRSNGVPSPDATLRLFSINESRYFEFELTDLISTTSGEWSNLTVDIGPQSQGWISINSPDWQSITGLEFELNWSTPANPIMKIDDLRFQKYVSFLETGVFGGAIVSILMYGALEFSMNWILWAGVLLIVVKVFREKVGPWAVFFIVIGYIFIVSVVYTMVSAALVSTLPQLHIPLKTWPPTTETEVKALEAVIKEKWFPNWAYWGHLLMSGLYLPFIRDIWITGLCAIVIRLLSGITWKRAASISVVAFILRFILLLFFGI